MGDIQLGPVTSLTPAQVEALWTANGGDPTKARVAAAIVFGSEDTTGNAGICNDTPSTGDYSVGLWEINYFDNVAGVTAAYGSPQQLAADPNLQARAVVSMSANGTNWHDWGPDFGYPGYSEPVSGPLVGSKVANWLAAHPPPPLFVGMAATPSGKGYWLVTAAGAVSHFGDAGSYGSLSGTPASPVVGMAATAGGLGYWLVAADGGVAPFGNAKALSPSTSAKLPSPVVGMAATAIVSAKNEVSPGYWLAQADGTVTAYGAAVLHPGTKPSAGIVGIAAPPSGAGYWLVAADGGVFGYGVPDHGSMAGKHLNKPMVGMAATPDGLGYWLVAADGGIFNYGSALLEGSEGNKKLNAPVVGMAPAPLALATAAKPQGYWLVAADGGIFSFGDAPFSGSGA